MTTLSLIASKKVFEIVGEYETEKCWIQGAVSFDPEGTQEIITSDRWSLYEGRPSSYNISSSDIGYGIPTPEWSKIIDDRLRGLKIVPTYTFSELIRVLPKIGEKMCWNSGFGRTGTCLIDVLYNMSIIYMNAPTEPEGMQAVEDYLMRLL